jgi:hypothetical protein
VTGAAGVLGVVTLPLALAAIFGLAAPALARRLPPALGSWLLSFGAVLAAAASSASLGLIALVYLAQLPLLRAQGQWSDAVLRGSGVPPLAGLLASVAVAGFAMRVVRVAWRRIAWPPPCRQRAANWPSSTHRGRRRSPCRGGPAASSSAPACCAAWTLPNAARCSPTSGRICARAITGTTPQWRSRSR